MAHMVTFPKCEWCGTYDDVFKCACCGMYTCPSCLVMSVCTNYGSKCKHEMRVNVTPRGWTIDGGSN